MDLFNCSMIVWPRLADFHRYNRDPVEAGVMEGGLK